MTLTEKLHAKGNGKRIFWTLCVLFFCIADQRLGSATGEAQLIFTNGVSIVIALVALSHYPFHSFLKPVYYIWGVLSLTGAALLFFTGYGQSAYPGNLAVMLLGVIIYGFCILRTLHALIFERVRPVMDKRGILLFGLFLVFAVISRYDNCLNILYFFTFAVFYLTAFTAREQKDLLNAILDGIILGFFLLQGLALIFRPFDTLRYMGMYANPNMNALFYQAAYCAFLGRFCLLETSAPQTVPGRQKRLMMLIKWSCFLFACCMWSLSLFTMCRSALVGMGTATLLAFCWCMLRRSRRKFLYGIRYALLSVVLIPACFPLVYGAVRYIPPLFHHPVFFYDDYSEVRVHSWDPWDSPKYTGWEIILQENFQRLQDLVPSFLQTGAVSGHPYDALRKPLLLTASIKGVPVADASSGEDPFSAPENPQEYKSTNARLDIYRYYLGLLNLFGHKEADNGIQLTETYFAPHAHNIFLQYAFNYGMAGGILFLVFIASSGIRLFACCLKNSEKKPLKAAVLLLFAATVAFGMTELIWRFGMLSNTLLFLIPFFAWTTDNATTETQI